MFEPFQRLGDHDTATGIGLGLAVARGFTEVMGGTLTASETPGGGLTMTVALPTASDPAKADAPRPTVVTKVVVIDDEAAICRALRINLTARSYDVKTASDGASRAWRPWRGNGPTSSSSTSACPTWTARTSSAASAAGPARRSSCCRPARTRSPRSRRSTPAPTTTSPSRSGWTSCWPACAPPSGAPTPAEDAPVVATEDFTIDLAAKRVRTNADGEIKLTPTQWQLLEVLVRNRGKLVTQRQLLHDVWGPAYSTEVNYLRVYVAQLRRKLEPDPAKPRYLLTETGMGYRFEGETVADSR